MNKTPKKDVALNPPIRRTHNHRHFNEDFLGSTRTITHIGLMTSEEPPRADPKRTLPSTSPLRSLSTYSSGNNEDENLLKTTANFVRLYYGTMMSILFWMFLPVALPLLIFKTVIRDCLKIRRIFVITLECTIMQLQLIFEMMSCIQKSNSSIDEKIERMGRSFHFLNMFNPIHWIGMLLYYADRNNHHVSPPAKVNLVDQGNQTSSDNQATPGSKQQTKGVESGKVPTHKNTQPTLEDEKLASSEDEEDKNADNRSHGHGSQNTSTSTLTDSNEKRVTFKSRDENSNPNSSVNDDSNTLGVDEVDESF